MPERRCIVTRESAPKDSLVRFVPGPTGEVVPDVAERLPGRGLWITARRDIVGTAVAKKLFSRAAKRALSAPEDLAEQVAHLLTRRCIDTLALANRAGLVRAGYQKVSAAVSKREVALLLTASDSEGQDALALNKTAGHVAGPRVLTAAELGRAIGRDACVNVAVVRPGTQKASGTGAAEGQEKLTARLRRELTRLEGFGVTEGSPASDD